MQEGEGAASFQGSESGELCMRVLRTIAPEQTYMHLLCMQARLPGVRDHADLGQRLLEAGG
eukprot:4214627-Alexandrium_andersonii.AAC.1